MPEMNSILLYHDWGYDRMKVVGHIPNQDVDEGQTSGSGYYDYDC